MKILAPLYNQWEQVPAVIRTFLLRGLFLLVFWKLAYVLYWAPQGTLDIPLTTLVGTHTAGTLNALNQLREGFINTKEDSLFAVTNNTSTTSSPYAVYNASTLPEELQARVESLKQGVVEGPFFENGFYKLIKLIGTGTDTAFYARASHILFRSEDSSDAGKKAAQANARKVLAELKAGANFAAMSRQYGTDGTASNGGDLGWFGRGTMVKPFEKAVFAATKSGLLNDVVETDFGYHIINVTGVKNNKTYTVALIEEEITPSDETQNEIFRNADNFSNDLDGVEAFLERAKKDSLNVFEANDLGPSDRRISNLGDARQLITWAYREGKIGKVSEATDVNGDYVIAVVTKETEEGYKPLDKELKETLATQKPYKEWIERITVKLDELKTNNGQAPESKESLLDRQQAFEIGRAHV